MNDNTNANNEEESRWSLHRWYAWKNKLNGKSNGIHLLKNSKSVLFCGTEYNGRRVDQYLVHKLTFEHPRFGNTTYKDVLYKDGSTPLLRERAGDSRVSSPVSKYFFDVIVFDLFERVPVLDKNKKQKTYTRGAKEGEPMWEYKIVLDKARKKEIQADIENLVETGEVITAKKMFISVGSGHFSSIEEALLPSRHMSECGGSLVTVELVCESCGATIDSLEDTDLEEQEDFNALALEDVRCTQCGHVGRPVPIKENLDSDDPSDFKELGPSRVIVDLKMVGKGKDSKFVARKTTRLENFLDAEGKHIIELDDNGEAVLLDDEPIFVEGLDKAVAAHWDFEGSIAYPDHEVSADLKLSKGDVGYVEPPEGNSGGPTKRKPRRRRTF